MKEQLRAIIELCDVGVFSSFPVFSDPTGEKMQRAARQYAADRTQDFIAIRAITEALMNENETPTLYRDLASLARDLLQPISRSDLIVDGSKVKMADGTILYDGQLDTLSAIGLAGRQRLVAAKLRPGGFK
jgi:hypothetical protein